MIRRGGLFPMQDISDELSRAIRASGKGPSDDQPLDAVGFQNLIAEYFLLYLRTGNPVHMARAVDLDDKARRAKLPAVH